MRNQKMHLFFLILLSVTLFCSSCAFRKTPEDCVLRYLNYLKDENYAVAYNLISSKDKLFISLSEFERPWSGEFIAELRFINENRTHKVIDTIYTRIKQGLYLAYQPCTIFYFIKWRWFDIEI